MESVCHFELTLQDLGTITVEFLWNWKYFGFSLLTINNKNNKMLHVKQNNDCTIEQNKIYSPAHNVFNNS